jgi:hypothetical protein
MAEIGQLSRRDQQGVVNPLDSEHVTVILVLP